MSLKLLASSRPIEREAANFGENFSINGDEAERVLR
jgi:hypothetical protein